MKDIINSVKNQIAKEYGFSGYGQDVHTDEFTLWDHAMLIVERTTKQKSMYDSVIERVALAYNNVYMKAVGDNIDLVVDNVICECDRLHKLMGK